MIKKLCFFLCCSLPFLTFSQAIKVWVSDTSLSSNYVREGDTIFKYKNAEKFSGLVIGYFDKQQKRKAFKTLYVNGYPESADTSWHRDGSIKYISHRTTSETNRDWTYKQWDIHGKLRAVRECSGDSCGTHFFFPSGKLKQFDGEIAGIWDYSIGYCENGQKIGEFHPNYGKLQTLTTYYCNGQKEREMDLLGGRAVGKFMEWHENGKIKTSGQYKIIDQQSYLGNVQTVESKEVGKWQYFDEKGNLIKEENF